MIEKIKVNINKSVEKILLKDMELFEFNKKDGSLNKNAFYISLISNYHETFHQEEQAKTELIRKTLEDLTSLKKDSLDAISAELAAKLSQLDLSKSLNNEVSLSIKPTKNSMAIFAYIEKYMLSNRSLSNFYRSLFESYSLLPQDLREQIIFKTQFDSLLKAIKEKRKIHLFNKNGKSVEVSPYLLVQSKEELFNYLLAGSLTTGPTTFRLSRIDTVSPLNEPLSIPNDMKLRLDLMNKYGPQYVIGPKETPVIVELTDAGVNMFKLSYVNRPIPTKIDGNVYYFDSSHMQIYQYFVRFGRNATVKCPAIVAERIFKFHRSGYFHYKEILNPRK